MSKESIIAFSQAKAELLWLQDLRQAAFDKLESLALPKIECVKFHRWNLGDGTITENEPSANVPDFTALGNNPKLVQVGTNTVLEQLPADSKRTDITSIVYEKTGSYQGVPAQDFIYNAWAPALTINIDGKDVSVAHHYQKMQPSKLLTDPASPYMHLTYAETEFYLAEAAARHWNVSSESAKEHYKKGLVAAIKQWSLFGANVPDDATLEALAEEQSSLLDAGDTEALEEINKQLWLLYILDPIEAWSNIRRSGMPSKYTKFYNLAPTENESDGKRPNRMMYPLEEQIKNKENLEEALSRMGGTDSWTSRVWWDKE